MPIVTHELESIVQPNGSTSNTLRMYDQDARPYIQGFFAPAGFDLATKVANTINDMNEQLANSEFETLIGQAE